MSLKKEKNIPEKFIKETYNKLHSSLTQFLLDTNYSNIPSIKLRYELEEFKTKMINQEKMNNIYNLNNILNHNSKTLNKYFPLLINQTKDPNLFFPNSLIYTPKNNPKNIFRSFHDINYKERKENQKSLNKNKNKKNLNIKINSYNQYNDKYYKYNNEEKNKKFFHKKFQDIYNNTLINKGDLTRGIYDMNVKKLIPRDADVSPSLNLWGNPFKITGNEVTDLYKKTSSKDDIGFCEINKLVPNKYNLNEFYKTQPISIKHKKYFSENKYELNEDNKDKNYKNKNNLFITTDDYSFNDINKNKNDMNNINIKNKTMYNIHNNKNKLNLNLKTVNDIKSKTFYDLINQKKIFISDNKEINIGELNNNINNIKPRFSKTFYKTSLKTSKKGTFSDFIKNLDKKNNIIIKYFDFELIKDSEFEKFKKAQEKNWKIIENILANFKLLFEKLNMNKSFIDSNKILKLIEFYKGKINFITNKDLLACLNSDDLKEKGYDLTDENSIYEKIKLAFIIRIQKTYRQRLSYKKYQNLKFFIFYLIKTQKYIKGRYMRKKIKKDIEEYRKAIHDKYKELLNKFKEEYTEIKLSPRVEIHINSISFKDNYNNCITDKFPMKESLQLSRLISLKDPNVKIIYIIPYELPDEIISYYFSIMDNLGIKDIDNRVQFIIPEAANYLPLNYSLTKLLFFSPKSLEKIKNFVGKKKSYIIPGLVGDFEEYISVALNIPMLMGTKDNVDLIFNKSGIKGLLEINNIPFPISAWRIISEDEFYSSMVHLISSYPKINIWIFKCNFDYNATGIAYLNTDKIDIINEFRNRMKNNNNITDKNIFKKKLFFKLKNILNKYATFVIPNLYKNWNEYLSHFLSHRGVIECCPTKGLSGIMGKPCIPILIEPNGIIKVLPSYEKINVDNFKNILITSPQKCIDNSEMINLGKKVGNILYNQGIIGYACIECITFHNGEIILYWCVDIKYGYSQIICNLQYSYFLYSQSIKLETIYKNENNYLTSSNNDINLTESSNYNIRLKESQTKEKEITHSIITSENEEIEENKLLSKVMVFSIPYVTCDFIYSFKLKELLHKYKVSNIIFNLKKKEGIILNLCDDLECGIFGICGVVSLDDYEIIIPDLKLWRMIDTSVSVIKEIIFGVQKSKAVKIIKNFYDNNERSDKIDFQYILNKVKKKIKEKEQEQVKEEEKRRKLAKSIFI